LRIQQQRARIGELLLIQHIRDLDQHSGPPIAAPN
jgi:hypothetical protein